MLHEFPIEQELAPAFRAALKSIGNSQTTEAADEGEIIFLNTKVFSQDYIAFCDNFAASRLYPLHVRGRMCQRREAIYPYLEKQLVHGGVSHAGFTFNVFMDKASGVVIHWESQREPG